VHETHCVAPEEATNVPAAHGEQMEAPAALNEPGEHAAHTEADERPVNALALPLSQGVHSELPEATA
jgi:hypothetical protein